MTITAGNKVAALKFKGMPTTLKPLLPYIRSGELIGPVGTVVNVADKEALVEFELGRVPLFVLRQQPGFELVGDGESTWACRLLWPLTALEVC